MLVLGIETSCDETSASIIYGKNKKSKVRLLSNVVASSVSFHAKSGGIIPETAARQQLKFILPVIREALEKAGLNFQNPPINYIALTVGPGLIGSLLVGVETAKTFSMIWNKPIIPVNHLIGHLYANWLVADSELRVGRKQRATSYMPPANIDFPALGLIVSGGHTDLVLIRDHGKINWIGGTRDDAAGEALDKIGRILGLPYPAGPVIEKLAKKGDPNHFDFPRPMIDSKDFDLSFSGLKASVFREIQNKKLSKVDVVNICYEVQESIVEVLVAKTINAAKKFGVKSILLGGGVAANQKLRDELELKIVHANAGSRSGGKNLKLKTKLFVPAKSLCTDNGAMIAAAAFYNTKVVPWQKIDADPSLHFDVK